MRCYPQAVPDTLAAREELEALVRHYHHLESEHERAHAEGSVRRHLETRLHDDGERFERVLTTYVADERSRRAWRDFLHHRGGEPPGPPPIKPLVFKGRSDEGSVVEIRQEPSGELTVELDDRLVERLRPGHSSLAEGRRAVFRVGEIEFRETFDAKPSALAALRRFVDSAGSPPWDRASVLLADGLIDVTFGLTERGRRALAAPARRRRREG